jgi:nucleoid DNA-binding protein
MEQNRNTKKLPVRKCSICGGTYFRELEIKSECLPDRPLPIQAPVWILQCLCGALQTPDIGGLHGGRTPNVLVSHFMKSLDTARQRREARADRSLVETAAQESLAPRKKFNKLTGAVRRLERLLARRQAHKDADGKIKGGTWREPKRSAASNGRDRLALEVQKRGLTFDQARTVVTTVFERMRDALKQGDFVDVPPLGRFSVKEGPKPKLQISLGKVQHRNQQPKKVVFQPAPDLGGGSDR